MKTARIAALLALLFLTHAARGQESNAPDATLEEIQQHLKAWRSQFSSISVTWDERNPEYLVTYRPELKDSPLLDGYYARTTWLWADQRATRYDESMYQAGTLSYRQVHVEDRTRNEAFKAIYNTDGKTPPFLRHLTLEPLPSSSKTFEIVEPLYGLWVWSERRWLDELIELNKVTLQGHEEIRGLRCPKLQVDNDDVWLDPTHSYLPVKSSPMPAGRRGGVLPFLEVLEFREVKPGIWFPWRGTWRFLPDPPNLPKRWQVTELSLDKELDASLFTPPQALPETIVTDEVNRQTYRPGDYSLKRPKITAADPAPPVPRVRGLYVAIGVSTALAIGLGAWLIRRRRVRESEHVQVYSKVMAVLVFLVGLGICAVYSLVIVATVYLIQAWPPAAVLVVVEALGAVVALWVAWVRFPPQLRVRFRFSLQAALLATAVIAGALGLALHLQPHIAWRRLSSRPAFPSIQKLSVVPVPEVAVPTDWQQCSFGPLHLAVPPRFGNVMAAQDGSCVGLNDTEPGSRRSIYIGFPLPVDQDAPNRDHELSAIELELACYRAGREDFHWAMTHDELRWHQWRLAARRNLLRPTPRGWAESLLGQEIEGVLLFIGHGPAFFEWRAKDDSVEGGVTFYGIDETTDAQWIRAVCRSAKLSGEYSTPPSSEAEALRAFEAANP